MATITLKGNEIHTSGELPPMDSQVPPFTLVDQSLADKSLEDFPGKRVLNIFPSVDTPVCAMSVRAFNEKASSKDGVTVLNVSADLPFAMKRFCAAEGLEGVHSLSTMRGNFLDAYGIHITDGPMAGLAARAVLVLDGTGKVIHRELVPEIAQEPDYEAALAVL